MPYKKVSAVYRIQNIKTKQVYIGSSNNVFARKSKHFHHLTRGDHPNRKLQEAYDKYGKESFTFELLEVGGSREELYDREQYYIDKYNSSVTGYNISGNSRNSTGVKYTEEVKKKLSLGRIGEKNHFWGKHLTDEHKKKISQGNKGKKHSQESIDRTRQSHFKPIINIDTGKEYPYITLAAKEYGVTPHAITNALRGKSKTCKGCRWRYKEEI